METGPRDTRRGRRHSFSCAGLLDGSGCGSDVFLFKDAKLSLPHKLHGRETEYLQPKGGCRPGVQVHEGPVHHHVVDNILDVIAPDFPGDFLTHNGQPQQEEDRRAVKI